MKTIGVLIDTKDHHKEKLIKLSQEYDLAMEFLPQGLTSDTVHSYDVILGNPPISLLKYATNLKLLHLGSAGVDGYTNTDRYANKDVLLINASGAYGLAISEWLLTMHLALIKKIPAYIDNMKSGSWQSTGEVQSIWGSTVICVGLGDIGSEYAKRIKALGGYVIGVRRTKQSKPDYVDEVYTIEELASIIGRGDVIALSLPATDKTDNIIDKAMLERMKPSAVILNVGRGNAIDTNALCECLKSGRILGAGLDVTAPEPLPKDHELWRMDNVIITPHVSGGYSLPATHDRIIDIMVNNLSRFCRGEEIEKKVNLQERY